MNWLRKALVPLATVALVTLIALVISVTAPRAVHAVVAAMVQVVNTTANPAITQDTSKQASQIVTLIGYPTPTATSYSYQVQEDATCATVPYIVPAGMHLVVTTIDAELYGSAPANNYLAVGNPGKPGYYYEFFSVAAGAWQANFRVEPGFVIGSGIEPTVAWFAASPATPYIEYHGYLTPN